MLVLPFLMSETYSNKERKDERASEKEANRFDRYDRLAVTGVGVSKAASVTR